MLRCNRIPICFWQAVYFPFAYGTAKGIIHKRRCRSRNFMMRWKKSDPVWIMILMFIFCNSAGAITHPEARWDYVRVGTLLYGQFPAAFLQGTIDLRPTWQAKAQNFGNAPSRSRRDRGLWRGFSCSFPNASWRHPRRVS